MKRKAFLLSVLAVQLVALDFLLRPEPVATPVDFDSGEHMAHAETYLGSIVSGAGADTTNISTAAPFVIPPMGTFLTFQCNATAYVAVNDTVAVTSTRGVTVGASALFLTHATGKNTTLVTVSTVVYRTAIIRIAGPAAVTCNVWARDGNE